MNPTRIIASNNAHCLTHAAFAGLPPLPTGMSPRAPTPPNGTTTTTNNTNTNNNNNNSNNNNVSNRGSHGFGHGSDGNGSTSIYGRGDGITGLLSPRAQKGSVLLPRGASPRWRPPPDPFAFQAEGAQVGGGGGLV